MTPDGAETRRSPPTWLPRRTIRPSADEPPILLVVVDTEEEFDWNAPFDRFATSVRAMGAVDRIQTIFDDHGVRPIYVVDYPVVSQPDGFTRLRAYVHENRAVVGAHLHPWVSPPFEEEVNRRNSFAGNLPPHLESTKIRLLGDRITEAFGHRPLVYKAGRYGLGPNTASILEQQGYLVDLSASPTFDYRDEGGPDYSGFSCHPYWFGTAEQLLGVPNTAAHLGLLGERGAALHRLAARPALRWARIPGVLSRLGIVERLRLSPEGFELDELQRLTLALLRRGLRVLTLSFHSPSAASGYTPYVRDEGQRDAFLGRLRDYLAFFLHELGGRTMTPLELRHHLHLEEAVP